MNIVFLFSDNFPGNSAYSNRVHSLAKGLQSLDNNVEVAVVYPGFKKTSTLDSKTGVYDNVFFNYYCFLKYKPNKRIFQLFIAVVGIIHFMLKKLFSKKRNKPDVIISCSSSLLHLLALYVIGKIRGIKIFREYNEYPKFIQLSKRGFFSIRKYKLLDGFIFMTERLRTFFNEELLVKKPEVIINMSVDTDRFRLEKQQRANQLIMVGDLIGQKDGIDILLKAFSIVHKIRPDYTLLLVGNYGDSKMFNLRIKQFEEFGISQSVHLYGIANRQEIPSLLFQSKIAVLPRPNSIQAESGFPTKLGEYLMSATPTVVTKTGEIENFLAHGENAYLSEPNDPDEFAKIILEVVDDYEKANEVGINGRKKAEQDFGHIQQAKILHSFLLKQI